MENVTSGMSREWNPHTLLIRAQRNSCIGILWIGKILLENGLKLMYIHLEYLQ